MQLDDFTSGDITLITPPFEQSSEDRAYVEGGVRRISLNAVNGVSQFKVQGVQRGLFQFQDVDHAIAEVGYSPSGFTSGQLTWDLTFKGAIRIEGQGSGVDVSATMKSANGQCVLFRRDFSTTGATLFMDDNDVFDQFDRSRVIALSLQFIARDKSGHAFIDRITLE